MLAELVTALRALSAAADTPKVLAHEDFPQKRWVYAGGSMATEDVPPPIREHQLETIGSFLDFVQDEDACVKPEVFHSSTQLVALCDRNDRRARATLELVTTTRWDMLSGLALKPASMDQKTVLRFLRHELAVEGIDHVITALRRLDFMRRSDGTATIGHGKESLGRNVELAVQNAENIPERFRIVVAPYSTPGANQNVEVEMSLELDLEQQRVILRVLPDEIARGEATIQSHVRNTLIEALDNVPIFQGTVA